MPVVSKSKKEFDRLEVLLGVQSGRLRVADGSELLSLKRRQVFRLLAGLKHGGAASLVSKRRGRPSNNRLPEAHRDLALSLVRERYADFGPPLASLSGLDTTLSRAAMAKIQYLELRPGPP
jgi:Winged helix-turn helix